MWLGTRRKRRYTQPVDYAEVEPDLSVATVVQQLTGDEELARRVAPLEKDGTGRSLDLLSHQQRGYAVNAIAAVVRAMCKRIVPRSAGDLCTLVARKLQPRQADNTETISKYNKLVGSMQTIVECLKPRTCARRVVVAICSPLGANWAQEVLGESGTTTIGRGEVFPASQLASLETAFVPRGATNLTGLKVLERAKRGPREVRTGPRQSRGRRATSRSAVPAGLGSKVVCPQCYTPFGSEAIMARHKCQGVDKFVDKAALAQAHRFARAAVEERGIGQAGDLAFGFTPAQRGGVANSVPTTVLPVRWAAEKVEQVSNPAEVRKFLFKAYFKSFKVNQAHPITSTAAYELLMQAKRPNGAPLAPDFWLITADRTKKAMQAFRRKKEVVEWAKAHPAAAR